MEQATLKIVITADNKQAIDAISHTIDNLEGVNVAGKKAGKGVQDLGGDFLDLTGPLKEATKGMGAMGTGLNALIDLMGPVAVAFGIAFAAMKYAYDDAKKASEDYDEAVKKSVEELTKFNVKLYNVQSEFKRAEAGVISKEQALKTYNKELGSSIGYADNLVQAENNITKVAPQYIKTLKLKTQANVFYAKAANMAAKVASGEVLDMSMMDVFLASAEGFFKFGAGLDAIPKIIGEKYTDAVDEAQKQIDKLEKAGDKLMESSIQAEQGITTNTQVSNEERDKIREKSRQERLAAEKKLLAELKKAEKEFNDAVAVLDKERDQRKLDRMAGKFDLVKSTQQYDSKGKETSPGKQNEDFTKRIQNLRLLTNTNGAYNQIGAQSNEILAMQAERMKLASGMTDFLMNSFESLNQAMANGMSFGEAIGVMFKRIAADIAKAALKAIIFQTILSALGMGGAEGFKKGVVGIFKGLLGFSEGGTVSGPTSGYPVMLHGTEHIVRPDQMKSIIASASQMGGGNSRVIVEGRIKGNDIFLSQQRTGSFRTLTT